MRISFDLDGTLFVSDPALAGPLMFNYVEPYKACLVREGAPALLRELGESGWDVWIYTNALYSRKSLLAWAHRLGLPVTEVVNQQIHENVCAGHGVLPIEVALKMPHWFGIDLHVDDSETLAAASASAGFHICHVATAAPDWLDIVKKRADQVAAELGHHGAGLSSPN